MQAQRDLVRHRRGGQEDRLRLPEQDRRTRLELVDRRILALLLVAHPSGGDRRAHARRRLRGGIGAQVDHAVEPNGFSCL